MSVMKINAKPKPTPCRRVYLIRGRQKSALRTNKKETESRVPSFHSNLPSSQSLLPRPDMMSHRNGENEVAVQMIGDWEQHQSDEGVRTQMSSQMSSQPRGPYANFNLLRNLRVSTLETLHSVWGTHIAERSPESHKKARSRRFTTSR